MPLAGELNEELTVHVGGVGDLTPARVSFAGGSAAGRIPPWHIDEFLGPTEFSQNYGYVDNGSSKADSGKLGDSDSPILRAAGEELDDESAWVRCQRAPGQYLKSFLHLLPPGYIGQKTLRTYTNSVVYVPDIGSCSPVQNFQNGQLNGTIVKRQTRF